MPNVLFYDPNSTPVANRVVRSLVTSDHYLESQTNFVRVDVIPERLDNLKVVNGAVVQLSTAELRQIEKAALDSARASRWSGKSPTEVLNGTRFKDLL